MSKNKYPLMFAGPVTDWVRWFAWRPVNTEDRGFVWLQYIYRRRVQTHEYINSSIDRWWQYAKEIK